MAAISGARTTVRWPVLRAVRDLCRSTQSSRHVATSTFLAQKKDGSQKGYIVMTGTFKCQKPNCPLCQHVVETKIVTSKASGRGYQIPDYVTCDSANVNYMIECLKCGMQYVGSTGRKVRLRGAEHIYDVQSGRYTGVSQHFNQKDHSVFDLAIIFIQRALRKKDRRLIQEAELIRLMDTVTPEGMNKIMPILRHTMEKEGTEPIRLKPNAVTEKTRPKMTWMQTKNVKDSTVAIPPFDSTPKRRFHRLPSAGDTDRVELLERNGIDPRQQSTSKCTDNFYMGKLIETLERRKTKRTQRKTSTCIDYPNVQYGLMLILLTTLGW